MDRTLMKTLAIVLLISAGLLLAGCAGSAPTPNPTDPLLSVHAEGGLCVYGCCSRDISILQNGTYTVKQGSGQASSGALDSAALARLKQAIAAADFNAIRSKPFTGICPIAADGQEYTFTFYRPGGATEVLDSCKSALDMTSPLFKVDY
jgi:hypothetical protein